MVDWSMIISPDKASGEMHFNRSLIVSVFIHGAVLAGIFALTHAMHRKEPVRLPQTITLISLPMPEKISKLPPAAPTRVQVGGAKKQSPPSPVIATSEPVATPSATNAVETNPVPSTNPTNNETPAASSAAGSVGSSGNGAPGEAVRIGSIGNLDNVEYSPLYNPKPAYPVIALKAGIQGSVDVDLVVNEFGRIDEFAIVNVIGHPLFGEETAKVIGKWRFPPPRVEGKKVKIKFLYTVNFKLD